MGWAKTSSVVRKEKLQTKVSIKTIGSAPETVTVVSDSPIPEGHRTLEILFNDFVWDSCTPSCRQVSWATNLSPALTVRRQIRHPVVLCKRELPLGIWKHLLKQLGSSDQSAVGDCDQPACRPAPLCPEALQKTLPLLAKPFNAGQLLEKVHAILND